MAPAAFVSGLLCLLRPADAVFALLLLFLSSLAVQWATARGPMLWPVVGTIPSLFFHIHRVYDWVTESVAAAGGTFPYRGMWLTGSRGVITVDPANVEHILKTHFNNFPKGRYFRERFADFLGAGIFNADDCDWREQRRVAAVEMHSSLFADYSAETVREILHAKLLPFLRRLAGSGAAVDLQDVLLRFTFDNICATALGEDPGCLAGDRLPEVTFARAFEAATELSLFRFVVPPFVWKTMKLLSMGTERRLKLAVRTVHEFAEKTVSDRREESRRNPGLPERSDILSRLVIAGDGHPQFSDNFLKDFCISFILAGRDTSSVALAWSSAAVADEDEVAFTTGELKRMEYLQAALTETMRLYPPVPVDLKEAAEGGELPDGAAVGKGARVIYSIYSMGRMEAIWGKDCLEFKPERWMTKEGGAFTAESPFKYPVFNGGLRLCVGKKFAYMQMKMVAAAVVLRYRVVVSEGQEVVPKMTTTLYMKNGLRVTVEPRKWE
ncbi:Cytochrome P450 86B1 [Apostasia shenzhenica]|uniref:noroxomaritidine synthase n=1 Tax=Apostasia shenzhenica TaxID=1088818 RepID=A0A2I0BE83_9ASPA|nr:Cytochrome P450 86B1 [Apostasia shenzhenica]